MNTTRRDALIIGFGGLAALAVPGALFAQSGPTVTAKTAEEWIADFTGGGEITEGGVTLTAPEIAENGNTVPIEVSADGAAEILLLASGNPTPGVAIARFGPAAGSRQVSTRIRLAATQDVIAIAKMEDGSFRQAKTNVKVTIGGCGG